MDVVEATNGFCIGCRGEIEKNVGIITRRNKIRQDLRVKLELLREMNVRENSEVKR
jgi:hypothetical protein